MPLSKDQSNFDDIRSLAICINIKEFNQVNKNHSENVFGTYGISYFGLLNEGDSALKVAEQITFRVLIAYKPAANKKSVIMSNLKQDAFTKNLRKCLG